MRSSTKPGALAGRVAVWSMAAIAALASSSARAITFEEAALAEGYAYDSTGAIIVSERGIDSLSGANRFTAASAFDAGVNVISGIDTNQFSGLGNLRELYLYDNQITSLESGDFAGLGGLQILSLVGNQIATIEPGAFSDLASLEHLHLNDNRIARLDAAGFAGPASLRELALAGNQITTIRTAGTSQLSGVQYLILAGNRIAEVEPGALSGLTSLEYLGLESNQIARIEPGVFAGLDSLRTLRLDSNQITSIDAGDLSGLGSLEYLSLDDNQIASIESADFASLDSLQGLNLGRNRLTRIQSGDFSGLASLRYLSLNDNHIASIEPGSLTGMSCLVSLEMQNNQLSHLDLAGAEFRDLESLSVVSGNPIASVDLSGASLSDLAFVAVMRDLAKGDIGRIDLGGADLSAVAGLAPMYTLEDVAWLDLARAKLPDVGELDDLASLLEPHKLDKLALSWGQWLLMDDPTRTALALWDAGAGNVLVLVDRPGDANGDGKVDDLDASILAANWQRTGSATWQTGDFNGDGNVNDLDASILAAHWQAGVSAAVPEPAAGVLLVSAMAAAGVMLAVRRCRECHRLCRYSSALGVLLAGLVAEPTRAAVPAGYAIVFNEEFTATRLSDTMFGYQWTGYEGTRSTAAAVSLGGGFLTLTSYSTTVGGVTKHWGGTVATKNYDNDNRDWTYGYFEARIKFSNNPGNCMAFWLESDAMFDPVGLPASAGNEVDIIEHRQTDGDNVNIPNMDKMTLHKGGYGDNHKQLGSSATIASLEDTFHVFGLLWTSAGYEFYVDDVKTWTYPSLLQPEWWYQMISNGPEWIVLDSDPCGGWCGTTLADYGSLATSTTKMVVDYVRVYQAGVPGPGDANGDGKVNDLDASILAANWLRSSGTSWRNGDFNADGRVNDQDASILAAHWQAGVSAAVPEPAAWVLVLAAALLGALAGRGKRG